MLHEMLKVKGFGSLLRDDRGLGFRGLGFRV